MKASKLAYNMKDEIIQHNQNNDHCSAISMSGLELFTLYSYFNFMFHFAKLSIHTERFSISFHITVLSVTHWQHYITTSITHNHQHDKKTTQIIKLKETFL